MTNYNPRPASSHIALAEPEDAGTWIQQLQAMGVLPSAGDGHPHHPDAVYCTTCGPIGRDGDPLNMDWFGDEPYDERDDEPVNHDWNIRCADCCSGAHNAD